jgi:hypothetical protein
MNPRFGAAMISMAVAAALASACGNDSTTSATPTTPTTTATTGSGGTPAPTPAPAPAPALPVSDPGGEWNLTGPAGQPSSGCISLSDISGTELDWSVQAQPGHAHRILLQGIVTRGPAADCSTLHGGDAPRSLGIAGGGWTILAGDQSTRTIIWPTEQCVQDGGHFQIDIQVRRDVPSVGPADQESRELIVNCGPSKP